MHCAFCIGLRWIALFCIGLRWIALFCIGLRWVARWVWGFVRNEFQAARESAWKTVVKK